ncbi:MAG: M20/M25/M40 family metallo-hydrolase [Actinobacteria bacterium]|nr:MAG: M20/M25/M40 family metallo-hydrolase [Actinomycetota bacterium]
MINNDRLLKTFLELIKIDSPSLRERKVGDYVISYLGKLGIKPTEDDTANKIASDCGNLLVNIAANSGKKKPVLLNAHLDTVAAGINIEHTIDKNTIVSQKNTILGADDKAGIAAILEAVHTVIENAISHCGIEIAFTVAEEIGLLGAKNLDLALFSAKSCYSFDGAAEVGGIINRAPSQNTIEMVFKGKSAHAGADPKKGVNAIVAASKAISAMKLGSIDEMTTANVGVIKGGKASNIIPDHVYIKAEARSHDDKRLDIQTKHMIEVATIEAAKIGAGLDVDIKKEYRAFFINKEKDPVKICKNALKAIGVHPQIMTSGGGSDANVFNEKGIDSLVLATGYKDAHSFDESIKIEQLNKAAMLALKIIEETHAEY